MSADSAVTYTSIHSEARSWSIPSEDPYEEAAQQLFEQAPCSPGYVPENHIPVYILKPEHPEDLVPAEDEAPIPPLPPSFLAPRIRTLSPRALEVDGLHNESSEFCTNTAHKSTMPQNVLAAVIARLRLRGERELTYERRVTLFKTEGATPRVASVRLQMILLFNKSMRYPGLRGWSAQLHPLEDTEARFYISVMIVCTMQSVKFYGLLPASRRYRSFVLVSYPV
ncbi:hypothetical protein Tco_0948544 [Tanacetum coccineum]